jgi:DNA-binding MarR family transcriptional regulator
MKPFLVLSPLHKAFRQVQILMNARCRPFGVSTVEAHLIGYCLAKGPRPISELHRVLGQNKSTLTAILDRLEARELVARRLNPSDRRSWMIDLTPDGDALARKLRNEYKRFESFLLQRIEARDLAGFRTVMAVIGEVTEVALTPGTRPSKSN